MKILIRKSIKFKNILFLFSLFLGSNIYSQSTTSKTDYKKADSVALNFPRNKYYFYSETAQELAESLSTEKEKCRAIFRWITNNIKYDYDVLNDKKHDCEDPLLVYKRKKAVCGGYSSLFKAMCDEAKIKCEYISGESITSNNYGSHAWNIVKLDGTWYIMDITWSSGNVSGVLSGSKYTKHFDELWWMADYNMFIKSHRTDDSKWSEYIEGKD